MKLLSILTTCLLCIVAHAEEPPQDALKYHDALIKHPHNPTLFNRFYDAWIDSQSVDTLQTFLNERAQSQGGIHHAILARFQLRRGLDSNAIESLTKAIDALPEDSAILIERANLLLQNQKFADARKDFERVTTLPNEALAIEAHKQIGKSHLREGNPDAAIETWEKILSKQPKNEELLEDLVELASAADQTEQALDYSQRLITASTDPYQKTLRLMRRGELLAKSGQTDQAIELWTKTLSETGEDSWLEREILALIQLTFRRIDRIDLLSNKLAELTTAHPRRLLIHRELAKLEAANGNTESAIGRFREVLRRSPGQIEIREEFIQLLIHAERFDDASAEIEKMIEADPKNPELHLRLADLQFQKSPEAPVIPQLEKALSLMDQTESSGLRIANLMIQYKQAEKGEALLQQLAAKPDASSAPLEALANEYIRTKRKEKAIDILTKIAASPEQETVLRATSAMAPLGNPEKPYSILLSRLPNFSSNNYFLTAFIQSSLAAKKSAEAVPSALKLVRASKLPSEIAESTKLATTLFAAAEKIPEIITQLETTSPISTAETCLLAALYETQKLHEKSDALFKDAADPALLRFHASILSVRGDFPKAISTLNLLAQSPAAGNASYFKELSDLQLRAGDIQACLKTLDQWKTAAPTDKTPWTISTRLHRESGNYQAAIESSRRALTRFPQDEDLTAILADLYQQSGQRLEAERIYWTLYDQAPDTTAQSRWAARLSALAANYGQTEPLKEKLLQRARSNQQAIGPILALVELARASRNHQELLEYLYQALRIKPKDADIRIQIANAEKQVGNIEKQIAILNEGIPHDTQGRIRTTLAQALIDQGQVLKGMHMLRALSGERASDPRLIETAANSIAGQGMIAEAIQYLEESLPPNSDWRARYLLASLLQQDGREFEATSILLSIVDAKDEIPNLSPNPNFESIQRYKTDARYYLSSLISHISQELYYIKNPARSGSGQQRPLPSSPDELRFRAKILLALISNIGNPAINEKINATKIDELDLFTDIVASHTENGPDYLALINKHPDNKDLIQMVVQQGRLRDPNTGDVYSPEQTNQIYQKLLKSPVVDDTLRILIISASLQSNPKDKDTWDTFFKLITNHQPDPNNPNSSNTVYQLQNILTQHRANIPAEYLPKIREMLISKIRSPYEKLSVYALLGEADPWIDAVNEFVSQQQQQIAQQWKAQQEAGNNRIIDISQSGFYPQIPQIQNIQLSSVNIHYFQYISSDKFDISGNNNIVRFAAKDLVKKLDRFESPVIRAWVSILAGDEKAIKKSLSVKPSEIEANDFAILKICLDIENKRYPEACRGLLELSKAPSIHAHYGHWAQTSFLAVLSSIPPDKNKEFLTPAREIITSYIKNKTVSTAQPWSSHYGNDSALLPMCKKLGFDDLVTQLTPKKPVAPTNPAITQRKPAKAVIGKPLTIVSGSTGTPQSKPSITPLERLNQFSTEKKYTAAAHEFFIHVQSQKKQGYELNYIIAQLKLHDEVKKAIINLADPGNNPSLSKRLQFAEICLALGHKDKSLITLRSLAAERPFDANINILLAFNLPPEEVDTAAKLLSQFGDSSNFYTQLNNQIQRISQNRNNETYFNYFALITKLIETSDNRKFDQRAFSELNNHIYYFLSGSYLNDIPSLFNTGSSATPDSTKHREISRKLCFAMLNHPMLAESGFRYLRSIKWLENPDETDQLARKILIQESQQSARARNNSSNLPEFSTSKWLCDRVKQAESPKSIITPEFLSSLRENDPPLADLFESLYSVKTTKDIAKIWESGIMDEDGYYTSRTLVQRELLEKIATIPDATEFFISRIKNLSQNEILNSRSRKTGESNHLPFIRAAITSCKNQKQTSVLELCKTIIKAIYGENFEFTDLNTSSREYQIFSNANNIIENILNNQDIDPATAVHIFRAFDEKRIPIQNYYWLQNSIQKNQVSDPAAAMKLLESMGFLNDTQSWKPIAHSTMVHEYDRVTGESSYHINRVILNEIFIQNFDYRLRTKEFVALLENRQPRTFGNLVTAALFSNGSERERLMTLAFEHAAPKLAKATPSQFDDLNLLTSYLPPEATEILPQKLQAKVRELNEKKIAELYKNIEMLFEQFKVDPTIEPLNSLNESVLQLCAYDVKKAAEVFLRGYDIHKANIAHYSGNNTPQLHQSYLGNILRNLSSRSGNKNTRPETAFQFYRSVMDSPVGPEFGHGRNDHYGSYLYLLGSNLYSIRHSAIPDNTHGSLRPWMVVNKISPEYQNDALAAITCYTIASQSMISPAQLKDQFDKAKDLSDRAKEIITSCSYINNIRYLKTDEDRKLAGELFIKLLNTPEFDSNTRTQIAFSALNTFGILTLPAMAESYANLFTELGKRDVSIISTNLINCLSNTAHLELKDEVKPHLKKISEAFWENANTPKTGGHISITDQQAGNLFLFATKVGDAKAGDQLFPIVKSTLTGKLPTIISFLSSGNLEFATALIPDDNSHFQDPEPRTRYTPELHQHIVALRESKIDPIRLIRLECALLKLQTPDGNHATPEFVAERREFLVSLFEKHPNASVPVQMEILSALATSTDPSDNTFSEKIHALAESIDPDETIRDMTGSSSSSSKPSPLQKWNILCKAASSRLIKGDAGPTNQLLKSIIHFNNSNKQAYVAQQQLLTYLMPATCFAIANDQNDTFAKLIDPLSDLVVSTANHRGGSDISSPAEWLTLCEFISKWENRQDTVEKTIERIQKNTKKFKQEFSFPRRYPWLSSSYFKINDHGKFSPELKKAYVHFLKATLAHPNMSDLLPGHYHLLDINFENKGMEVEILEIAHGPQDAYSAGGRAINAFHRAMDMREKKQYKEIEPNLRDCLSLIPEGDAWCHFRGITKMFIVNYILTDPARQSEARPIFETILPKEISEGHSDFYQSLQKRLPAATEPKPE